MSAERFYSGSNASLHVSGLSELNDFLVQLAPKLQKNIMKGAMVNGARLIRDEAKSICPVGDPNHENTSYHNYSGALRDSIVVKSKTRGTIVYADVQVGGKTKKGADVWYAHLIELTGAASHIIQPKVLGSNKWLRWQGNHYAKRVEVGMAAEPFLRPALDSHAMPCIIKIGNYIKEALSTKAGLDTSEIVVEEE